MRLHSDDFEVSDHSDTQEIERRAPPSFSHRHGLKVLGGILAVMFVTVIAVQVAC
jgi:hypothetical protein